MNSVNQCEVLISAYFDGKTFIQDLTTGVNRHMNVHDCSAAHGKMCSLEKCSRY